MLGRHLVFALQRRPEIGRIVGVQRDLAACLAQRGERVFGKGREDLQFDVRDRTDLEHDAFGSDAPDEIWIFNRSNTVADT